MLARYLFFAVYVIRDLLNRDIRYPSITDLAIAKTADYVIRDICSQLFLSLDLTLEISQNI